MIQSAILAATLMSSDASLACAPDLPVPECMNIIAENWAAGDAIIAGEQARALLQREFERDGHFMRTGDQLAFIAGIGSFLQSSYNGGRYWLWVAHRHREVCPSTMMDARIAAVIDSHHGQPGQNRGLDRRLRRSSYLAAPSGCRDVDHPGISLTPPTNSNAPAAVVLFRNTLRRNPGASFRATRIQPGRPPQVVFEYPDGAFSVVSDETFGRMGNGAIRAFHYPQLVLDPCVTVHLDGDDHRICRADQPTRAGEEQ